MCSVSSIFVIRYERAPFDLRVLLFSFYTSYYVQKINDDVLRIMQAQKMSIEKYLNRWTKYANTFFGFFFDPKSIILVEEHILVLRVQLIMFLIKALFEKRVFFHLYIYICKR